MRVRNLKIAAALAVTGLLFTSCTQHKKEVPKKHLNGPAPLYAGPELVPPTTAALNTGERLQPMRVNRIVGSYSSNGIATFDPHVCNTTGWTLSAPAWGGFAAVYDSSESHDTCGSIKFPSAWYCTFTGADILTATENGLNANKDCPSYGGSAAQSGNIAVVPGAKYTLSMYVKSAADPKGTIFTYIGQTNSSGVELNPGTSLVSVNAINSKKGIWEEVPIYFTAPASGYVKLYAQRFMPDTYPISNMYLDDFFLTTGWNTREAAGATTGFTSTWQTIDADGNIRQKMNNGSFADFFPKCIQPSNAKTDYTFYANNGWNCFWSVNPNFFGSTINLGDGGASDVFWNGSAYVHQNWSHDPSNTSNPLAKAERAVNATYAPEGMMWMIDINGVIRNYQPWADVQNAIRNITANGWNRWVLGWIHDAEANFNRYDKMAAVLSGVATLDSENNSGSRRHPIFSNVGFAGSERFYTDTAGTHLNNYHGVYAGSYSAPFEQLRDSQNVAIPAGYCQMQSGLGWSLKAAMYNCLGNGGKMMALWADNGACKQLSIYANNYNSCPIDEVHPAFWSGTSTPDSQSGEPFEPVLYSGSAYKVGTGGAGGSHITITYPGDFKTISSEIDAAMPLLKTAYPASYTATSSNANVNVYPRTLAGEAYLVIVNQTTSSQVTTITVNNAGGTPGNVQNYFTGAVLGTFTGSNVTLTVSGLGPSSGVGAIDGGTEIVKISGTAVTTTTTTTPTTTTTIPTTTTLPGTLIDDTSGTVSYAGTWTQYGPGAPNNALDYLSTIHETDVAGATFTIPFNGTAITLYGVKGPYWSLANVTIDGSPATGFDAYAATEQRNVVLASYSGLSAGNHTLTVTVVGGKPVSPRLGSYIALDVASLSGVGATTTTTTTSTTTTTIASTTTLAGNRNVVLDAFIDANNNGVQDVGEGRMANTTYRVLNNGAVVYSGKITTAAVVKSVPNGSTYSVKYFPPLRATTAQTVAIASSGEVFTKIGGCCALIPR